MMRKMSVGDCMTWYLRQTVRRRERARFGRCYSLMMCGWRKSFRIWISRFSFGIMSVCFTFSRFRILTATTWPVTWCVAPGLFVASEREHLQITALTLHFAERAGAKGLAEDVRADLLDVRHLQA